MQPTVSLRSLFNVHYSSFEQKHTEIQNQEHQQTAYLLWSVSIARFNQIVPRQWKIFQTQIVGMCNYCGMPNR